MVDYYLTAMVLGGAGLAAMALGGHGRGQHGGHANSGHLAGTHAVGGHHTGTHNVGAHHTATHSASAHGHAQHANAGHAHNNSSSTSNGVVAAVASLMSPRSLFTLCLGIGATGVAARPFLGGLPLLALAIAGGLVLERVIVTPMWNAMFKFESKPALTLESAAGGDATVVSTFDKNGQGLISIELDGQMLQVLGTLRADDRLLGGRISVGTRVRIDEVDAARHRCTVSLL